MSAKRKSWRDVYPVHPAADVFPMMSEDELRELGEDIKKNGLREPIRTFLSDRQYVVDGRNRLDAMELVGIPTVRDESLACTYSPIREGEDPATFVISANIRRRHLTKKQQADLIVKMVDSAKKTPANMAKVSRGKRRPAKDPVKAKVLEEAQKNDISKRTAERALTDHRTSDGGFEARRSYVTCPECSASVADLDHHLKIRHKKKSKERWPLRQDAKPTVQQLEKALMNTKEVAAECNLYAVLGDKPGLKKLLKLCDEIEDSISLIRERIDNRPSDTEIRRALSAPPGGTSKQKRLCVKCAGTVSKAIDNELKFTREVVASRPSEKHGLPIFTLSCGHEVELVGVVRL